MFVISHIIFLSLITSDVATHGLETVCVYLGSEVVRAASSGVQLQLGSVHRRGKKGDGKLSGKRKSEQEALRR